jgi:hypothetical protein
MPYTQTVDALFNPETGQWDPDPYTIKAFFSQPTAKKILEIQLSNTESKKSAREYARSCDGTAAGTPNCVCSHYSSLSMAVAMILFAASVKWIPSHEMDLDGSAHAVDPGTPQNVVKLKLYGARPQPQHAANGASPKPATTGRSIPMSLLVN